VAFLCPLFAAASGPAYKSVEVKNGGTISGQVNWKGEVPKEASTEIPVAAVQQAPCHCRKVSLDRLKIDPASKGVAQCVVYIARIAEGKPMPAAGIDLMTGKPALLDQAGCRYMPEVMVVPPGTQLTITSSDTTAHNVNARMGIESRFNLQIAQKGVRIQGAKTSVGTSPGVISLACNAGHPWMSGYIHVAPHPYYAVTDKQGRFELKDVPAGSYTLVCWHANWTPRLLHDAAGSITEVQYAKPVELTQDVRLEAGKSAEAHFELSASSAPAARK
jgi:hypothetical protein